MPLQILPFFFTAFLTFFSVFSLQSQPSRWQQRVDYVMDIRLDVKSNQYKGYQKLAYTNNSPDTLTKLFYHLYFNAFQPGSMMDVRSRNIEDPDGRVKDRIFKLTPAEYGWIKVGSFKVNGVKNTFETNETILEITLDQPILPKTTAILEMNWDAQVPLQIRRSGRDNAEGIRYSMTQWYPKLCEYDYQGWHANPYIAREFYGVWGDYDVKITLDKSYVVAAGAYCQNPLEVGSGYEDPGQTVVPVKGDTKTWHFKAPNVHDFAWAADPDYAHTKIKADDGSIMHFFWQGGKGFDDAWNKLPGIMNKARNFMNEHFGKYPYKEYYFIQGGDGGMEYPMATLIRGESSINSLVGVAVHEQLHSWYQMVLGTNESLYGWMDEGFTSYAETLTEEFINNEGLLSKRKTTSNPFEGTYTAYSTLAKSGKEEPLTTHADHFHTNYAYSVASYVKGSVFLHQLGYIIGQDALDKGLLKYLDTWKFKHPNVNDCIRVFENQSGLELDWYKEDWVNTTNKIDYAIKSVEKDGRKSTKVTIARIGDMAMPLDIEVTYSDGEKEIFYAPLESMRGIKPAENKLERTILPDHRWVDPEFSFEIPSKMKKIASIAIDAQRRMADIDISNNTWENKD